MQENAITRRRALAGLSGSATAVLAADTSRAEPASSQQQAAPISKGGVCRLMPQAVEGPYYFDPALERADITEGRPGIPLRLDLQVVDGAACVPIAGARVDVWHCDATGHYSGYTGQGDNQSTSTKGEAFLRGTQMADSAGAVTFRTIYPGWYRGRTAHIHFKVFLDKKTVLTGQCYFPDALSEFIYTTVAPYTERKDKRDTLNSTDFLVSGDKDHTSFVAIKEEADAYVASLVIGVDREASPQTGGPGGPPPGGGGPSFFRELFGGGPPQRPMDGGSLVPGGAKKN
jgi:protocatechuate 3,4-dioxygenase beta subunit